MARFFKKRVEAKGLAPGSLVFIGNQKIEKSSMKIIHYDKEHLEEIDIASVEEIPALKGAKSVSWLNIYGIHDTELIQRIGEIYDLHPLVLEDILNTGQRPKLDEFNNCHFLAMKMLQYDEEEQQVNAEQLSLVLGKDFLITFQERPGDVFEPVRDRIRKHKGRIRSSGNDYLAYALMDTVIDNYIYIVERIGEQIEDLEEKILENPQQETLNQINAFKHEISFLGKVIRPAREMVTRLTRTESDLFHKNTLPFVKDLLDLVTHTTETIDTYREILSDYLNIYHTSMSNRMNEVMKILTIFAAIFIPLTFIAGIYGTNFEYIPELGFRYSYFIMWGVIVVVTIIMLRYFRRKKWF